MVYPIHSSRGGGSTLEFGFRKHLVSTFSWKNTNYGMASTFPSLVFICQKTGKFHLPILIMCLAQELGSPLTLKLLLSWESGLALGPAEAVYRCVHLHTLTCLHSAFSRERGGGGMQRWCSRWSACRPSLSTELVNLSQADVLPVISVSGDKDKGPLGPVGYLE